MNALLYRQYMCDEEDSVFEAIKRVMPWMHDKHVIVQQDNASPHCGKGNTAFFETQRYVDG